MAQLQKSKKYIQTSKRFTAITLIVYTIIVSAIVVACFCVELSSTSAELITTIVGYLSTFTSITMLGYFGNSGLEKYSKAKFQLSTYMNEDENENSEG